jgi:GTP pyrophosphokinase
MIEQSEFLANYRIDSDRFKAAGLQWNELTRIFEDYVSYQPSLEPVARYVTDCLRQVAAVHSIKIRLKDPEHVIEKIIRRKMEDPSLDICVANYKDTITDLIGIRALHLFKEDWTQIHDFITSTWELSEKPVANIRRGDAESFIDEFRAKGCEIMEHTFGYRSVHYLVKSQPTKDLHIVEIQVRTIFEEAWSEIDHRLRYPHDTNYPLLNQYLFIFNRLAGSADEMASFARYLKCEIVGPSHASSREPKDVACHVPDHAGASCMEQQIDRDRDDE